MKIKIHYEATDGPWGGINSFFRNLKKYIQSRSDLTLVEDMMGEYDIFLYGTSHYGPGLQVNVENCEKVLIGEK